MTWTVLLLCILIQRILGWRDSLNREHFFDAYARWFSRYFRGAAKGEGLYETLLFLLPPILITMLLSVLAYHWFGRPVYYVFNFVVIWFFLDAYSFEEVDVRGRSLEAVMDATLCRLFGIALWYALLGAAGVVFYASVGWLYLQVNKMAGGWAEPMRPYILSFDAFLQWLPTRLLGLTFALVGRFSAVFQIWSGGWKRDAYDARSQIIRYATLALGLVRNTHLKLSEEQRHIVNHLVSRALWVWLVIWGVFVLGGWLG